MIKQESIITIHMVSSLDGFIAKKDGTVSWLESKDHYDKGVTLTSEIVQDFLDSIDCYVMGSATYQHAIQLGWPYGEVPVVVLTSKAASTEKKNVTFYSGDLDQLVNEHLKPLHQNIWVVGGAKTVKDILTLNLADEMIISIMPIILGEGTLFFDFIGKEVQLHLTDVTAYKDGMVELTYQIIKG